MLRRTVLTAELVLGAMDVYLLALLGAAALPGARRTRPPAPDGPDVVVLVPAHDEAASVGACVEALAASPALADRRRIVVVADNCTDATAAIARAHGATVLERRDPVHRGKGHALNWALERLDVTAGALAFVDADCVASPNFAAEIRQALAAGADAVQVPYVVANPGASTATALRGAAFALMNTVRPLGRSRLGWSAGVLGTGMAFSARLLGELRFDPASLVEDTELHLRLVLGGHRVRFAPRAWVSSPMPTRPEAIRAQQARWEGGGAGLWRFAWPLVRRAVRRRELAALSAAVELAVPPTSLLALAHAGVAAAAWPAGHAARRWALTLIAMQVAYVLGGLRVARAPRSSYRALLGTPVLAAQKLRVFGALAARGAPSAWRRTEREPAPG